jgi:hypothetical protein
MWFPSVKSPLSENRCDIKGANCPGQCVSRAPSYHRSVFLRAGPGWWRRSQYHGGDPDNSSHLSPLSFGTTGSERTESTTFAEGEDGRMPVAGGRQANPEGRSISPETRSQDPLRP